MGKVFSTCRAPPSVLCDSGDLDSQIRAVDLLLVLTKAAVRSDRSNLILHPFPEPCGKPKGPSSYSEARSVADTMPRAVSLMVDDTPGAKRTASFTGQKARISFRARTKGQKDRAKAFATAKWAIVTSPVRIIPLTAPERFSLDTPFQFILKHKNSSSRERRFRNARNRGKTLLAWHGSRVENWHSIVRNGLKVYSGSKNQVNGAAYGKGIYVSPHSSTSLGYCGYGWKYNGVHGGTSSSNPQSGNLATISSSQLMTSDNVSGLRVMALCEITGSVNKASGTVWVVPKANQIVVRALFVFQNNSTPYVTAESLRSDLKRIAKAKRV